MTRDIDETLIYKTKRKPRQDGLTDDECIAINLFWRKHIKVPILARVFRVVEKYLLLSLAAYRQS